MDNFQEENKIDFSTPTLSKEQIDNYLQRAYNDPEEPDAEISYYNGNCSTIRKNIEKGIIDPQVLMYGDILTNFINNGFDLNHYESFLPEYCSAKGLDYEEYMANRQQTIDELAAQKTENKSFAPSNQIPELDDYDYDDYDDYDEYDDHDYDEYDDEDIEDNDHDYDEYDDENIEDDDHDYIANSEYEEFLQEAAQTADLHPTTKQNWLSKMKSWMKENVISPIQKYFNKDER